MKSDTWLDRIALLLWRDRDGYEVETGSVGDRQNTSLLTRLRAFKKRVYLGWIANWKWWVTTCIAATGLAAAIAPLYFEPVKPSQKVNRQIGELLTKCIEQGKCIVRIEAVGVADNQIIPSANGNRRNHDGPPLKK